MLFFCYKPTRPCYFLQKPFSNLQIVCFFHAIKQPCLKVTYCTRQAITKKSPGGFNVYRDEVLLL